MNELYRAAIAYAAHLRDITPNRWLLYLPSVLALYYHRSRPCHWFSAYAMTQP